MKVGDILRCHNGDDLMFTTGKCYRINKLFYNTQINIRCLTVINDNGNEKTFSIHLYHGVNYKNWFIDPQIDRKEKLKKLGYISKL